MGQSTVLRALPEVPTGTPYGGTPYGAYAGRLTAETYPLYTLNSGHNVYSQYIARSPFD